MSSTRKRRVNLPALTNPEFLSLVDKPANRSGFKVIRSEDGSMVSVRRRLQRTDQDLLSIDLPEGVDRAGAEAVLEMFGMQEDYEIVERGENAFTLKRNDIESVTDHVSISMGSGIIANVAKTAFSRADTVKPPAADPDYTRQKGTEVEDSTATYTEEDWGDGYTLTRLTFVDTVYKSVETVKEWLSRNDVDFLENGVSISDGSITVLRQETEAEGYQVPIAEGVYGFLEIAERNDIPKSLHRTVLANLLRSHQEQEERSDTSVTEKDDMSKTIEKDEGASAAAEGDEASKETQATRSEGSKSSDTAAQESGDEDTVTRSDVEEIVTNAVAAALAAARKDGEEAEGEEARSDEDSADKLNEIKTSVESLAETVEGLRKDVEEFGDTTVARTQVEGEQEHDKRDDAPTSVFSGVLGNLG